MKKIIVILIAMGGLLAGCVGYVEPTDSNYRDGTTYRYNRDGTPYRYDRDRDGDGVRNSQDRRPDDGRRY